MKKAILFLTLFISQFLFAQKPQVLVVKLVEEDLNITVKNAALSLKTKSGRFQAVSDLEGKAYFTVDGIEELQSLSIENNHFSDTVISNLNEVNFRRINDDSLFLEVAMFFEGRVDDDFVVYANKLPDTIFGSDKISVSDFELLPDGRIILLTYEKRLRKSSQVCLLVNGEVTSSLSVPGRAEKLISDFRGNIHLVCKKSLYSIFPDDYDALKFGAIDKEYYFKYIAPIVDTNKSKMYFSNFNPDYPAMDYMYVDKVDTTYKHLLNIEDELMMEMYTSEYKWVDVRTKLWAMQMEQESGIDKRIWVGANFFTQSIYYDEIYAPMFMRNDSLLVFDHYKELLFVLNDDGEKLDSLPIYYHLNERQSGWDKLLVQDEVTGQVYSVYEKAGYTYLKWIDTKTGEAKLNQKLHFRYVEKLEIRDNKVYYIYRPYESTQKKFLYEEKLNVSFEKAKVLNGDDIVEQ